MKNWKRGMALLLTLVTLLGVLAGCGEKVPAHDTEAPAETETGTEAPAEPETAAEPEAEAPAEEELEPMTISWMIPTQQSGCDLKDTPMFKDICEKLNIEIELTNLPVPQHEEKKNLLMTSKELPDVISWVHGNEVNEYGPLGAFINLHDYQDQLPNFFGKLNAAIEENPDTKNVLYTSDNELYMVAHNSQAPVPIFDFSYVKSAFDEVGATELNTWDDVYNALKALKEAHPESYPLCFRGQGIGMALQLFCRSFSGGITDSGWMGYNAETDQFVFGPAEEGYKEAVAFFAKLFTEGLIHPEHAVLDQDRVIQYLNDGTCFMHCDYVGGLSGIPAVSKSFTVDVYPLPLPQAEGQPQVISQLMMKFDNYGGTALNGALAKDPEKLERCLMFLDYLYSEEFYEVQWHHPDVTNEDGTYKDIVYDLESPDFQTIKDTYFPWSMYAGFQDSCDERPLPGSPYQIYRDEYLKAPENADKYYRVPAFVLDAKQQEEVNACWTSVTDRYNVKISEFAEGRLSMDEWDAFVEELLNAGGARAIEVINEAYHAAQ